MRGAWGWLMNPYGRGLSPKRHFIPAGTGSPLCNGCLRRPVQLSLGWRKGDQPVSCRACLRGKLGVLEGKDEA